MEGSRRLEQSGKLITREELARQLAALDPFSKGLIWVSGLLAEAETLGFINASPMGVMYEGRIFVDLLREQGYKLSLEFCGHLVQAVFSSTNVTVGPVMDGFVQLVMAMQDGEGLEWSKIQSGLL